MFWLEKKYIALLSSSLEQFKQKGPELWNFRCPLCGDSKKSKSKLRGYIYARKGQFFFSCHNCTKGLRLDNFIKTVNLHLYDQYINERFTTNKQTEQAIEVPTIKILDNKPLDKLTKVSALPHNHICKQFVVSRQLPSDCHYKLFYCAKFKSWVNTIIPDKFESTTNDSARLIIPILDQHNNLNGFQGRALDPENKVRYITIMLNNDSPRIFGLDVVDFNKRFYCFEGPLDSLFIENSIAACGGKLHSELKKIKFDKSNCVIVYDNEPRNRDIVNNMRAAIEGGYSICIWPPSTGQKDVNDMVLSYVPPLGYCRTELIKKASEKIKAVIDENVFSGLQAKLKLAEWSKVCYIT